MLNFSYRLLVGPAKKASSIFWSWMLTDASSAPRLRRKGISKVRHTSTHQNGVPEVRGTPLSITNNMQFKLNL